MSLLRGGLCLHLRQQFLEIVPGTEGFEVRLLQFVGHVSTEADGVEEGGHGGVAGPYPC